ncbi:MAG TPA: hypothetical protein VFW87_09265 [Pirellulales bacterium]|nr:hypothetical protein [Pirellulales bacterium]
MINPLATYWMAAAGSGYAKPGDWQSWADAIIERCDAPDDWLIELSLAHDLPALMRSLASRLQEERSCAELDEARDDAILGYLWLRYERGELTLADCLKHSASFADSGSASIECELVFGLLNGLEQAIDQRETNAIAARAESLFAPMRTVASSQWKALMEAEQDVSEEAVR